MVMDIVQKLRSGEIRIINENGYTEIGRIGGPILNEAADEIERLREALKMWVKFWKADGDDVWLAEEAMEATRAALKEFNNEALQSKETAIATLQRHGILDENGQLEKRYRDDEESK
jgi:hypothetical protein